MKKQIYLLCLMMVNLCCSFTAAHATIRYVKPVASGSDDGTSREPDEFNFFA